MCLSKGSNLKLYDQKRRKLQNMFALWEDECREWLEFWDWNVNITTNHVILLIQFQEENIVSHNVHGAETHCSNRSKVWGDGGEEASC